MPKIPRNVSELRRAVVDAWPPTIRFIEWAASFSETPEETTTADLAEKLRLNKPETKDLVDGIAELGLARFVVGRRRQPSRLQWKFTLKSIVDVARGDSDAFVPIGQATLTNRSTAQDTIEHAFQLRRDFKAIVLLPEDLSKDEAKRVAAFIQTLPFEE
jgi:hypothetical protein